MGVALLCLMFSRAAIIPLFKSAAGWRWHCAQLACIRQAGAPQDCTICLRAARDGCGGRLQQGCLPELKNKNFNKNR
jgi:hypothetical protein